MLNIRQSGDEINIKGNKIYYSVIFIFYIGGLLAMLTLFVNGLNFTSPYSLIWVVSGGILFPILAYLFIWVLPGLIPGKTIISLVQGPNGHLKTKKVNVLFASIKEAEVRRNGLTLINVLVLTTHDGKQYRIPTYNLIDELDLDVLVDRYVYPHMTSEAQVVWDRKVNLEQLNKEVDYKRESF